MLPLSSALLKRAIPRHSRLTQSSLNDQRPTLAQASPSRSSHRQLLAHAIDWFIVTHSAIDCPLRPSACAPRWVPRSPRIRNIPGVAPAAASCGRVAAAAGRQCARLRLDAGAFALPPAAGLVDAMQVWQALGPAVLQLNAREAGLDSLGSIVGHSALQAALKQCIMQADVICIGSDARFLPSPPPAAAAGHTLSAGDFSISCALLVGADGAASRVRAHSGIGGSGTRQCASVLLLIVRSASAAMNYSSHAVVATLQVSSSRSPNSRAHLGPRSSAAAPAPRTSAFCQQAL